MDKLKFFAKLRKLNFVKKGGPGIARDTEITLLKGTTLKMRGAERETRETKKRNMMSAKRSYRCFV